MSTKKKVTDQDVLVTLSQLSGIPTQKLTQTDAKKYLNLEAELHKRVIGHDRPFRVSVGLFDAINQVSVAINVRSVLSCSRTYRCRKTELAKALAEVLFDDESALIRFDMSEYMEKIRGQPPQRSPSRLCGLRRRRQS